MLRREDSLRNVVQSWIGINQLRHVRITRFSRSGRKLLRYVYVEASGEAGAFAIAFFRHDDGSWRVFPPAPYRPAMGSALRR
ncbi:hypothetical protein B0G81_7930 [Paraburkholderia sp. BL6665CI2N2]|nr:hypothetical protein B0G81_7930 [Paraburkholderia sp. BL6665CI2N2]